MIKGKKIPLQASWRRFEASAQTVCSPEGIEGQIGTSLSPSASETSAMFSKVKKLIWVCTKLCNELRK